MISPCAAVCSVATHPHENRYCYLVVPLTSKRGKPFSILF
jgi:hypothetical protein